MPEVPSSMILGGESQFSFFFLEEENFDGSEMKAYEGAVISDASEQTIRH